MSSAGWKDADSDDDDYDSDSSAARRHPPPAHDVDNDDAANDDASDTNCFDRPASNAMLLLSRHADCTPTNALRINQHMRQHLQTLRTRLESMLQHVRDKYAANERLLLERQRHRLPNVDHEAAVARRRDLRQTSVLFYGAPFFKTVDCYSPAYNGDYLARRRAGHLHPIELTHRRALWLVQDKLAVIAGVRVQVEAALQRQHKDWLRGLRVVRKADASVGGVGVDGGDDDNDDEAVAAAAVAAAEAEIRRREALLRKFTASLAGRKLIELMRMLKQPNEDGTGNGEPHLDDPLTIDWYSVSQAHLDARHSSLECQAMWQNFLRPALCRSRWTRAEEEALTRAVATHRHQNWPAIARQLNADAAAGVRDGSRSAYQCFVHYRTKLFEHITAHGRWTPAEDAQLLAVVRRLRCGDAIPWDCVAKESQRGRTRDQCYYRYMFTLRPDIRHDRFTVEEDCILMAAYKQHGLAVERYQHLLPGRTRVQIRNRYKNVLRAANKQPAGWTEEADERLVEAVAALGEKSWPAVAERVGDGHSRQMCRSRYVRIARFLRENAGATVKQMTRRAVNRTPTVTEETWLDTLVELKQRQKQQDDGEFIVGNVNAAGRLKRQQAEPDESEADEVELIEVDDESAAINRQAEQSGQLVRVQRPNGRLPSQLLASYLGYAWRLSLRPLVDGERTSTANTETVCRVLRTAVAPVDFRLLHGLPDDSIDMFYLDAQPGELMADESGALTANSVVGAKSPMVMLPASRCTALLLRGLAVMFSEVAARRSGAVRGADDAVGRRNAGASEREAEALQLFRYRFRALLTNAVLMSRLDTTTAAEAVVGGSSPSAAEGAIADGMRETDDEKPAGVKVENTLLLVKEEPAAGERRRGVKRKQR